MCMPIWGYKVWVSWLLSSATLFLLQPLSLSSLSPLLPPMHSLTLPCINPTIPQFVTFICTCTTATFPSAIFTHQEWHQHNHPSIFTQHIITLTLLAHSDTPSVYPDWISTFHCPFTCQITPIAINFNFKNSKIFEILNK